MIVLKNNKIRSVKKNHILGLDLFRFTRTVKCACHKSLSPRYFSTGPQDQKPKSVGPSESFKKDNNGEIVC